MVGAVSSATRDGSASREGPAISVVVPTRDRPGSLSRCLDALVAQDSHAFEVIVVDDGSADHSAVAEAVDWARNQATARWSGTPLTIELIRGSGDGPAQARNLGVEHAKAPVIAFTDDDCRPDHGWLDSLLGRFLEGCEAVAGATANAVRDNPFARASQAITNHLCEHSLDSDVVTFAPTSNIAALRSLCAAVPFDGRYPLAAGEDRDWCARLIAAGAAIRYEPAARVEHFQDLDARAFWRQQVRYGRGAYRYRSGAGHDRHLPHWSFYRDLLLSGFRQSSVVGGLIAVAQIATAVGYARESTSA